MGEGSRTVGEVGEGSGAGSPVQNVHFVGHSRPVGCASYVCQSRSNEMELGNACTRIKFLFLSLCRNKGIPLSPQSMCRQGNRTCPKQYYIIMNADMLSPLFDQTTI